jgi:hypothetical protein
MTDIDRDTCRKAAAECVALARATSDPAKKELLLIRAQEWIKLAYAASDDEFQEHVAQLNSSQMGSPAAGYSSPQAQPMQQQQQAKTDDKKPS